MYTYVYVSPIMETAPYRHIILPFNKKTSKQVLRRLFGATFVRCGINEVVTLNTWEEVAGHLGYIEGISFYDDLHNNTSVLLLVSREEVLRECGH